MKKIRKSDNHYEKFSPEKLELSLKLAGADLDLVQRVGNAVKKQVGDGDSTAQIFREAFEFLVEENPEIAARYKLERGINFLGPSGFAFEQYVEEIFKLLGYRTRRNVFEPGQCATHEIDIRVEDREEICFVEAKYRNAHNTKTHIDQVMYADARGMDIERRAGNKTHKKIITTVITNTRFTKNAINYAKCRGLRLIGWDYPQGENLHTLTSRFKLYPITTLRSVNRDVLEILTGHGVVLLKDLLQFSQNDLQKKFGISKSRAVLIDRDLAKFLGIFEK